MAPQDASGNRDTLSWTVSGMDCAGCARKVQGAVERLPGVFGARVSVMSESMTAELDPARTLPEKIERTVARLGYGIERREAGIPAPDEAEDACCGGCGHDHSHPDDDHARDGGAGGESGEPASRAPTEIQDGAGAGWYRTPKGKLVVTTGALLAAAWAADLIAPDTVGAWGFVAASILGLAPVAQRAFAALRAGMPFTIEMLMTVAAAGALAIGAAEEAALVVFLFAVGEVLEGIAADRARAGIRALGDLVPKTALLVGEDGSSRSVPASSLRVGQTVLVRPGDRVPADGEIVEGRSGIDEAPVTGESVPAEKAAGDPVFAGSINTEAALRVRVTKAPEDNTIARIIRLVEEAEASRAPTERFIDRFSRWYMPVVVGLAALVAVLPPAIFGEPWQTWIYRGLALLLIGCPCALVISVPASISSALSSGARHGLLLKGGSVLEATARTTLAAFDKTGTLTRGRPQVTDVEGLGVPTAEALAIAAGVEAASSHLLADAVLARAAADGVAIPTATEGRTVPGRGVEAVVQGSRAFVGSPRHARELASLTDEVERRVEALEAEGKTVALVLRADTAIGLLALRDEPRDDAEDGVAQLGRLGVRALMLTGDNGRTAAAIAGGLGMEHRAELLPDGKVAALRELVAAERVMMIGDGINDAPALATAHVGVAMGSGTEVALEAADAALLRDRVSDVAAKIRLARAAMSNIRQNIAIALGLKGIFLVTTVAGITGLWPAILADTGATVLVTLNALRLLTFDPTRNLDARSETGPPRAALHPQAEAA